MASLTPAPILSGYDRTFAGLRLRERDDLAAVSLAVPLGAEAQAARALQAGLGLAMPTPTRASASDTHHAILTAPDQALLLFAHDGPDAEPTVAAALKGAFYSTDQTGAWVLLQLSGPGLRAALERLCPIDLHDKAFPVGAFARTTMEHMGAIVLRDGAESFLLMSASSSAMSFLHAIETSIRYVT